MEGSGAMLNLGHTDPPIKIVECHLDGVLAYAGFGGMIETKPGDNPAETLAGLVNPADCSNRRRIS